MSTKLYVRKLTFHNSSDARTFEKHINRALYGQAKQIHRDSDATWTIRDIQQDSDPQSFRLTIHVAATRQAIVEGPEDLEEIDITEFDQVNAYLLVREKAVFFEHPNPRSGTVSPRSLVATAQTLLIRHFKNGSTPVPKLYKPEGERTKQFFIDKLLQAADSPLLSVTYVSISGIHGSSLSEDLDLFNPDKDWEELGRTFMPRANEQIAASNHTAIPRGDLSHNPMVRAQLGAGFPNTMTVEERASQRSKKGKKATFKRNITDVVKVVTHGRNLGDTFKALVKMMERGDFDSE